MRNSESLAAAEILPGHRPGHRGAWVARPRWQAGRGFDSLNPKDLFLRLVMTIVLVIAMHAVMEYFPSITGLNPKRGTLT
jgi:hypothetical protein